MYLESVEKNKKNSIIKFCYNEQSLGKTFGYIINILNNID